MHLEGREVGQQGREGAKLKTHLCMCGLVAGAGAGEEGAHKNNDRRWTLIEVLVPLKDGAQARQRKRIV